jgi:hypothetical protein
MSQAGIINVAGGGGGGTPIQTITGNDGVATPPTANNVNIIGATVANGTNAIPVYVKNTATSTDTIQVQVGEAAASSNIDNAGLASFNSADFNVDANGYVSLLNSSFMTITFVTHATGSPYVVLSTDQFIAVNSTAGTVTIELPNAPSTGQIFTIKDQKGESLVNAITVTTVGGVVTIDGATSQVFGEMYESLRVIYDGSAYETF